MAKRRARGEGSLRKHSDGRWEGRYTIGRDPETGKLIYRNVLARTQTECKTKLREAIKICGWIRKDSRLNPSRNRLSLSSSIRQGSGSALGLRCTPSRISGRLPRISTPISWRST